MTSKKTSIGKDGQFTFGVMVSIETTSKVQVAEFPAASSDKRVTVVVVAEIIEPGTGDWEVDTTPQLSAGTAIAV